MADPQSGTQQPWSVDDLSKYLASKPQPSPAANRDMSPTPVSFGPESNTPPAGSDIGGMVDFYANRYGLDPKIAHAMARRESGEKTGKVSPKGAIGVMQLMPDTARLLGVKNPEDPKENIEGGLRHLSNLVQRYGGDYQLALAAYHAGTPAVDKARGIPNTSDGLSTTRDYVDAILKAAGAPQGPPAALAMPQEQAGTQEPAWSLQDLETHLFQEKNRPQAVVSAPHNNWNRFFMSFVPFVGKYLGGAPTYAEGLESVAPGRAIADINLTPGGTRPVTVGHALKFFEEFFGSPVQAIRGEQSVNRGDWAFQEKLARGDEPAWAALGQPLVEGAANLMGPMGIMFNYGGLAAAEESLASTMTRAGVGARRAGAISNYVRTGIQLGFTHDMLQGTIASGVQAIQRFREGDIPGAMAAIGEGIPNTIFLTMTGRSLWDEPARFQTQKVLDNLAADKFNRPWLSLNRNERMAVAYDLSNSPAQGIAKFENLVLAGLPQPTPEEQQQTILNWQRMFENSARDKREIDVASKAALNQVLKGRYDEINQVLDRVRSEQAAGAAQAEQTIAGAPERTGGLGNVFEPEALVGEPMTRQERELVREQDSIAQAKQTLADERAREIEAQQKGEENQPFRVVDRRRVVLEEEQPPAAPEIPVQPREGEVAGTRVVDRRAAENPVGTLKVYQDNLRQLDGQLEPIAADNMHESADDMARSLQEQRSRGKALSEDQKDFLKLWQQRQDVRARIEAMNQQFLNVLPGETAAAEVPTVQPHVAAAAAVAVPQPAELANLPFEQLATRYNEVAASPEQAQAYITEMTKRVRAEQLQRAQVAASMTPTERGEPAKPAKEGTTQTPTPEKMREAAKKVEKQFIISEEQGKSALETLRGFFAKGAEEGPLYQAQGGQFPPEVWKALLDYGLYQYERGAKDLGKWSEIITKAVGENIRPHLQLVHQAVEQTFAEELKGREAATSPDAIRQRVDTGVRARKLDEAANHLHEAARNAKTPEEADELSADAEDARKRADELRRKRDEARAVANAAKAEAQFQPVGETIPMVRGKDTEIIIPGKGKVAAHYAVASLKNLIPSHVPYTWEENDNAFQPRKGYGDVAVQQQVLDAGRAVEPARIINTNPDAVNGPPIIRQDGLVAGGNGRTMIQFIAYNEGLGPKLYENLQSQAAIFGLDPATLPPITEWPVLVRVLDKPITDRVEMEKFGDDLNIDPQKSYSDAERGAASSRRMSENDYGWITSELADRNWSVRDLMREREDAVIDMMLRTGMVPQQQLTAYVDLDPQSRTKKLTEKGKLLFEGAVFGRAFTDAQLMEDLRRDVPSIYNKLARSLASIARITARSDDWNIGDFLNEAIALRVRMESVKEEFNDVRASIAQHNKEAKEKIPVPKSLVDWYLHPDKYSLTSGDLVFGDEGTVREREVTPVTEALAQLLDEDSSTVKEAFGKYAASAEKGDVKEQGGFDFAEPVQPWAAFNSSIGAASGVKIKEEDWGQVHPPVRPVEQPPVATTPQEAPPVAETQPEPQWPAGFETSPRVLSSQGGGGANYTAEDLAKLKERMGLAPTPVEPRALAETPEQAKERVRQENKAKDEGKGVIGAQPFERARLVPDENGVPQWTSDAEIAAKEAEKKLSPTPAETKPPLAETKPAKAETTTAALKVGDEGTFAAIKGKPITGKIAVVFSDGTYGVLPKGKEYGDYGFSPDQLPKTRGEKVAATPETKPEKKNDARARAKAISQLHAEIKDAPKNIEELERQIDDVKSFLDRDGKYDENWWDGFQRNFGGGYEDMTDEMEAADKAAMESWKSDPAAWKEVTPGFIGYKEGAKVPTRLFPSEKQYLEETRDAIKQDIEDYKNHIPKLQQQLAELKARGPLPEEIATKHGLTVEGEPVPPTSQKAPSNEVAKPEVGPEKLAPTPGEVATETPKAPENKLFFSWAPKVDPKLIERFSRVVAEHPEIMEPHGTDRYHAIIPGDQGKNQHNYLEFGTYNHGIELLGDNDIGWGSTMSTAKVNDALKRIIKQYEGKGGKLTPTPAEEERQLAPAPKQPEAKTPEAEKPEYIVPPLTPGDIADSIKQGEGNAGTIEWVGKDRDPKKAIDAHIKEMKADGWTWNQKEKQLEKDGWYAFYRSQGELAPPILQWGKLKETGPGPLDVPKKVIAEKPQPVQKAVQEEAQRSKSPFINQLKQQVLDSFPNMTEDMFDATARLWEARAKAKGQDLETWLRKNIKEVRKGLPEGGEFELMQKYDPEQAKIITEAGGEPLGIQDFSTVGLDVQLAYIQDPITGSSLAIPLKELNREAVIKKLEEFRKGFVAKAQAAGKLFQDANDMWASKAVNIAETKLPETIKAQAEKQLPDQVIPAREIGGRTIPERTVKGKKVPAASVKDQVLATLANGGVSPEEIKWSGIAQFLEGKDKASKQEIVQYLHDNRVQLEDVHKQRGGSFRRPSDIVDDLKASGYLVEPGTNGANDFDVYGPPEKGSTKHVFVSTDEYGRLPRRIQDLISEYRQSRSGREIGTAPRFDRADLMLPGPVENYHELLLTLPMRKAEQSRDEIAQERFGKPFNELDQMERAHVRSIEGDVMKERNFTDSHWDEPNVLAHVRFTERTDADGKKVLMVEEVQSDWSRHNRDAITAITQPESVRKPAEDLFDRKVASMMPLNAGDSGMLAMLQHDQVLRAVVSKLPVDVVNVLAPVQGSAKDFLSNPSVFLHQLKSNHSSDVALRVLDTVRSVGASLRAKLADSLDAGRDKELLPALRASDLKSREVVGLLAPELIYHDAAALGTEHNRTAAPGTELGPTPNLAGMAANEFPAGEAGNEGAPIAAARRAKLGGLRTAGLDPESRSAILTDILDRHTGIVSEAGKKQQANYIPAPFLQKPWEIATKRVLRYAAENGFDRVAWTTGEQQKDRYDLSNQVSTVKVIKDAAGSGKYTIYATPKNQEAGELHFANVPENELADKIGKDLAAKAIKDLNAPDAQPYLGVTYKGLDLKMGGEWTNALYDRAIPNFLNKYGKQWGAKVGESNINPDRYGIVQDGMGNYRIINERQEAVGRPFQKESSAQARLAELQKESNVHSIDVSPEMKKSVLQGQYLWQEQGNKGGVLFGKDGRAIIGAFEGGDVSTLVHETWHIFRRDLTKPELKAAEKAFGVEKGKWTVDNEEAFARAGERYLYDGEAPDKSLKTVFEKFKNWLRSIYLTLIGSPIQQRLTADQRALFDRVLGFDRVKAGEEPLPKEAVERAKKARPAEPAPTEETHPTPKEAKAAAPVAPGDIETKAERMADARQLSPTPKAEPTELEKRWAARGRAPENPESSLILSPTPVARGPREEMTRQAVERAKTETHIFSENDYKDALKRAKEMLRGRGSNVLFQRGDREPAKYNGKGFFTGVVDPLDGQIEAVADHKIASTFRHRGGFPPEIADRIDRGELATFVVRDGRVYMHRPSDVKGMPDPQLIGAIEKQIDIRPQALFQGGDLKSLLTTVGGYHFESGNRDWESWSKAMEGDLGKINETNLRQVYQGLKDAGVFRAKKLLGSERDPDKQVMITRSMRDFQNFSPQMFREPLAMGPTPTTKPSGGLIVPPSFERGEEGARRVIKNAPSPLAPTPAQTEGGIPIIGGGSRGKRPSAQQVEAQADRERTGYNAGPGAEERGRTGRIIVPGGLGAGQEGTGEPVPQRVPVGAANEGPPPAVANGKERTLRPIPDNKLAAPRRTRGEPIYVEDSWVRRLHGLNLPENLPVPTARLSDKFRNKLIFPGQKEVSDVVYSGLQQHDGVVVATSTGTGKTYMGAGILGQMVEDGKADTSLIVTKNRKLVHDWIRIARDTYGLDVKELPAGMEKPDGPGIFITTYKTLVNRPGLQEHPWDFAIADESGEARRWQESQQGDALVRTGDATKKMLYMSATPFHSPLETGYLGKLGMWDDQGFEKWASQFGVRRDDAGNWIAPLNPRKMAQLREQLIERGQFVNMDRNMEGYTANFGVVRITPEVQQGLDNAIKAFQLAEQYFQRTGRMAMVRAVKGNAAVFIKNYLERARLPESIEIAKRLEKAGWKVLFFSENKKEVEDIYDFLKPADQAVGGQISALLPRLPGVVETLKDSFGDNLANYSGAHSQMREGELQDFLTGRKDHLYATYGAGGIGVSLHDADLTLPDGVVEGGGAPRAVVYLGLPWSGVMFDQAIGRPWRFGTKSDVHAIFLTSNSEPELQLIGQKVAPRLASLRAGISGINANDPVIKSMQSIDGFLDYHQGGKHSSDPTNFRMKREDLKGVQNWDQIHIADAKEAIGEGKGMRVPDSDVELVHTPAGLALTKPPEILYQSKNPSQRAVAFGEELKQRYGLSPVPGGDKGGGGGNKPPKPPEPPSGGGIPPEPPKLPTSKTSIEKLTDAIKAKALPDASLAHKITLGEELAQTAAKGKSAFGKTLARLQGGTAAMYENYKTAVPRGTNFHMAVREWSGAENESALNINRFRKAAIEHVPNLVRQQAITRWIEANGDKATLHDWYERTLANPDTKELAPIYKTAMELTPDEIAIAKDTQAHNDETLAEARQYGMLDEGVENYMQHIWSNAPEVLRKLRAEQNWNSLLKNPSWTRRRILPTYFDGEQLGFRSKNSGFVDLVGAHERSFRQAIAARKFIETIHALNAESDGRPLVAESWAKAQIVGENEEKEGVRFIKANLRPGEEYGDYVRVDHPSLQGWSVVTKDQEGRSVFARTDLLVHPSIVHDLTNNLKPSALRNYEMRIAGKTVRPGEAALKVSSEIKQTILALSVFHQTTLGTHALEHRVLPVNMPELDLTNKDQRGLVYGGMMVAHYDGMQSFGEGLAGGGLIAKIPRLGPRYEAYKSYLFTDYLPRLKMAAGLAALERNRARYPELSEDKLYALTADQMNAAFGGLNYRVLGRSKTLQDFLRLSLMAPDFAEARARFAAQALKPYGKEQRVALVIGAAVLYTAGRILNMITDDDPHWDKPFAVVYGGKEYALRTVQEDAFNLATDPGHFIFNRLSPLAAFGIEATTGRDRFGKKIGLLNSLAATPGRMVPIPFESMGRNESVAEDAFDSLWRTIGINVRKERTESQDSGWLTPEAKPRSRFHLTGPEPLAPTPDQLQ